MSNGYETDNFNRVRGAYCGFMQCVRCPIAGCNRIPVLQVNNECLLLCRATETHERQRANPIRDTKFKAGLQPLDMV